MGASVPASVNCGRPPLTETFKSASAVAVPSPGAALAQMRAAAPLVHCITNYVAMNHAANVLLAAGASPAMVHAAQETEAFAGVAHALTINIGTISLPWVEGMHRAVAGARGAGRPWVLDPVAHFISPWRAAQADRLLTEAPSVIRGNASEILALAGSASAGKGPDAGDSVDAAEAQARRLAQASGAVVAVTGERDFVTDGARAVRITGGDALMTKVTATGCALTALVGAFAGSIEDRFAATVGALAMFKAAGGQAAAEARGPGSFVPAFLDALYALPPEAADATSVEPA